MSTLASRRVCSRRSTLKVPLARSGLCDEHQLQRPAHLRRASLLGLRRAPSSLGRRRKAAAALCCPPKAPIPFPLTTQAPWRSGRSGGSKDQAATARDLRRACKALGLRVTSERETPAGTAARSKCPLPTAARAATAAHLVTAHAAAHRSRGPHVFSGCLPSPRGRSKGGCGGAPSACPKSPRF